MVRTRFARELDALESEVFELGAMVDRQIERAVRALIDADVLLAQAVVRDDGELNRARFHIDNVCLSLLAQNAPHASDLRLIVAVLGVAAELERAGDHAEGIGRIAVMIGDRPALAPSPEIAAMSRLARGMLLDSLHAFEHRDSDLAFRVGADDDAVDALYDTIYGNLIREMIERPVAVEACTRLLWVAHNLERIADRSTNVAERVVFMVTGTLPQMNISTY